MYQTKEEAIEALSNGGNFGYPVFNKFRGDKEVVLEAIKQDAHAIDYASSEIQKICDGAWPTQRLEKAINYDNLTKRLSSSVDPDQPKRKLKI